MIQTGDRNCHSSPGSMVDTASKTSGTSFFLINFFILYPISAIQP
jgi:hypothetical protein